MDDLTRFKSDINLTEFAAGLGYRLDRRESSRGSAVMRHPTTDDKIVIARDERDGHWIYFSVRDSRDNGTIVDFLQRRGHRTIPEVSRELRSWIGGAALGVATEIHRAEVTVRAVDREAVAQVFAAAREVSNSVYLNRRGIRPETLELERFSGTFREDARRNVLFPHEDAVGLAGFESKNHGWTSFSPGGVKALWQSRAFEADTRLVLCESAIDAISFHQLHPELHARYASTAGSIGQHQHSLIARTLAQLPLGCHVVVAFDRDTAGEKLADQVQALDARTTFVRARSPVGKDWNDCLKDREREYIRSLGMERGSCRGR